MPVLESQLDDLRTKLNIDCDTLDSAVPSALGPFVDCTSNQAIAISELSKPENEQIVLESIKKARKLQHRRLHTDTSLEELAVDIMIITLQAKNMPLVSGNIHLQINPYHSYSATKIEQHAKRIIGVFRTLYPELDHKRICIKVPATWEGIKACRQLESHGITSLATLVFTMEQAALAINAGCTYVAPYVSELKVHFVCGYEDPDPAFDLARAVMLYSRRVRRNTRVIAASLTSPAEVLRMVHVVDHVTVAPHILKELHATPASSGPTNMHDSASTAIENLLQADYSAVCANEAYYTMRIMRSNGGANQRKFTEAINIFCDAQDELLALCRQRAGPCGPTTE